MRKQQFSIHNTYIALKTFIDWLEEEKRKECSALKESTDQKIFNNPSNQLKNANQHPKEERCWWKKRVAKSKKLSTVQKGLLKP